MYSVRTGIPSSVLSISESCLNFLVRQIWADTTLIRWIMDPFWKLRKSGMQSKWTQQYGSFTFQMCFVILRSVCAYVAAATASPTVQVNCIFFFFCLLFTNCLTQSISFRFEFHSNSISEIATAGKNVGDDVSHLSRAICHDGGKFKNLNVFRIGTTFAQQKLLYKNSLVV